jgi:hypothetical protein
MDQPAPAPRPAQVDTPSPSSTPRVTDPDRHVGQHVWALERGTTCFIPAADVSQAVGVQYDKVGDNTVILGCLYQPEGATNDEQGITLTVVYADLDFAEHGFRDTDYLPGEPSRKFTNGDVRGWTFQRNGEQYGISLFFEEHGVMAYTMANDATSRGQETKLAEWLMDNLPRYLPPR